MFRSSSRKLLALLTALVSVACAAPTASAEVARVATQGVHLATSVVGEPEPIAHSGGTTDADRAHGIEWRFHVGSSVYASPAIATDGTAYVGTGDGYVQAVNADGSLRWSYTVEGAVAWSPIVDAADHVIVATAARRLYSILPSGLPAWEVRPPVYVATDLALAAPTSFIFGAIDGSLWAYSIHGTALWHVEIGDALSAPLAVRGSRTAVGTGTGGLWLLDGARKLFAARLDAPLRGMPAILQDGSVVAVAGTALVRLDSHGNVVFRREGIDTFGVGSAGLLAVETNGDLVALGEEGTLTGRTPLPAKASAAPVEISRDVTCIATETGELLFAGPGASVRRVPIARAALHRPVLDLARGRVVVAAGSGTLAAVEIAEPR
jgi:hypothetical protein